MCWQRGITFPAAAGAPRAARTFVTDEMDALIGERAEITDDAQLVVSELVANAVNAGAGAAMVTLDLHHSHLRLAVEDNARGVPELIDAAATADHGRGLQIVAALSTGWGVSPDGAGKEVWADIDVSPPFTPDLFPCSTPHTHGHS